jgi:hypothetical protein
MKPKKEIEGVIGTTKLCHLISEKMYPLIRDKSLKGILPEFVIMALGGISNIYCEKAMNNSDTVGLIETRTHDSFATPFMTRDEAIQEIRNCTGFNVKKATILYDCAEQVLKEEIQRQGVTQLRVGPLGQFTVVDLEQGVYDLSYEDPARKDYHRFLLGFEEEK